MSELTNKYGSIEACQNNEEEMPSQAIISVPLAEFFRTTLSGDYIAKGIGMRNIGSGTIDITGEIPAGSTIEKAFLYWAVIPAGSDPSDPNGKINGNSITGQIIASPTQPCWGLDHIDNFRADVTQFVSTSTNIYTLTDFPSGSTAGENPRLDIIPPLLEGATLVVIYKNNNLPEKTIIINDGGVTVPLEANPSTTTFINLPTLKSPISAKTTYIVADGQAEFTGDIAIFNNADVAGPGTIIRPLDAFDGSDGKNLPNHEFDGLWDTLTVDVSSLIGPLDKESTAAILSGAGFDCLTYIAQILSLEVPQRGVRFKELLY